MNERSEPKLTERVFRLWRKERATRTPSAGVSRSQENTSRLRNNAKRSINYTGRPHRQASSASFLFFFLMPPPSVSKTTRRIARSPSAHPPSSPRGDKIKDFSVRETFLRSFIKPARIKVVQRKKWNCDGKSLM